MGELKVEVDAEQRPFSRLISSKNVAGVATSGTKPVARGHTFRPCRDLWRQRVHHESLGVDRRRQSE